MEVVSWIAPNAIKEQMQALGSDGVRVGVVDYMEGADQFQLAKNDPDAGGEHHLSRSHGSIVSTEKSI